MGVTGLWRLIEPAGKPVPVETLENKVLAVDISIWLHQMVKGYQDAKGASLPNAHLIGLFQRLCKLLYFRIKPVFVFDGAFPDLKKETIAKRQDSKAKYNSESERLKRELALLLSKKTAVSSLLGKQISPKKRNTIDPNNEDIFKLPALPQKAEESESESDDEDSSGSTVDLHSIDIESDNFKNMPAKEKYDLLLELKDTRKMNSWGRLHELPKKSDNFSDFQLQRLLKRRKVQECLEETEKEIGDVGMSLNDLESLLNEEGIDTKIESLATRRIASDNTTRFLMINNVKQALAEAKERLNTADKQSNLEAKRTEIEESKSHKKNELEEDTEIAIKMSLGCTNPLDSSKTDESWTSAMTDSDYSDSEDDGFIETDMSCAKAYIMQYSDFTHKAIDDLVVPKQNNKNKSKSLNVGKIIEELNNERSVIVDNVDLSSSDEECNPETAISIAKLDSQIEIELSSDDNLQSLENMDATQNSVVYVDKSVPDVISLDTSLESTEDIQEDNENKRKSSQVENVIDSTDSNDEDFEKVSENNQSLDTSLESTKDIQQDNENKRKSSQVENVIDSTDSSDEDFEEVPENNFKVPVVQITLNKNVAPDEDDIFSDIFSTKSNQSTNNVSGSTSEGSKKATVINSVVNIKQTQVKKVAQNSRIETDNKEDVKLKETVKDAEKGNRYQDDLFVKPSTSKVSFFDVQTVTQTIQPTPEIKGSIDSDEIDEDLERAIQMSLECVNDKDNKADNTNNSGNKTGNTSELAVQPKQKLVQPPKKPLTIEQLNTMAEDIQNEAQDLIQEKGRLDRVGRNITEQMTKEAQELLQIFGIPYIVAPMEAEAQCAFLESVKLTDGTITDDSDIWLFGGRTVYKNFFNQKKHVMQFQAERIERSFNLSREQLVLLALLVGSDYTTGVTGVGPVTALEILASFPFNKKQFVNETSKQARYSQIVTGLQEFKKWVRAGKRTDNNTLKKKLKNVDLTEDFPSIRVVQAYMEPNVEKSEDKFTWGKLDITILRDYAKAKFGWSQHKLDEIVKPVLKRLDHKSQKTLQDYFKRKIEFQSVEDQVSKRVKAAIQKMGPDGQVQEQPNISVEQTKPVRKRKLAKTGIADANINTTEPSKPKQQKKMPKQKAGHSLDDDQTIEENILKNQGVTIVPQIMDGKSDMGITLHKTDKFQEIIPQREKEKQSLLQNKLKAIEVFRKTKIDRKKKHVKRKVNLPKEKAELSESSDSD